MELNIGCSTWIKEDDEKVLTLLQESDRWLTLEEIAEATGLPEHRILHTLKMLKHQSGVQERKKTFFNT